VQRPKQRSRTVIRSWQLSVHPLHWPIFNPATRLNNSLSSSLTSPGQTRSKLRLHRQKRLSVASTLSLTTPGLIVVGEIEGTPEEQARTELEVRHSVHLFSMNPFLTVLRQGSIFRRRKRIQDVDEILPREQADWGAPYPSFVCWRASSSSWCWLLLCSVSSQSPEDANFLPINVQQKGCNW